MPEPKKPELTVDEILAYQPPPALKGWKVAHDDAGNWAYEMRLGKLHYFAIPDEWEGRTLPLSTPKGTNMGSLANGVFQQEVAAHVPGTFSTNNPDFRPPGAEDASTACPMPEPSPVDGIMGFQFDQLLIPGAILGAAALLYFKKAKGS